MGHLRRWARRVAWRRGGKRNRDGEWRYWLAQMMRCTQATSVEVEAAVAVRGVEAFQLDALGGAAGELLGHDLAAEGAGDDAVAAADGGGGGDDDHVAVAEHGLHAVAGDLEARRRGGRRSRAGSSRPSRRRPGSRHRRRSRSPPAWAKPSSGMRRGGRAERPGRDPVTRAVKASMLAPVASSTLAMLSVLGQRARPSGMRRLLGLKVVASSPERLARPEADRPYSAASVSSARQMSSCFMAASWLGFHAAATRNSRLATCGQDQCSCCVLIKVARHAVAPFPDAAAAWFWAQPSCMPARPGAAAPPPARAGGGRGAVPGRAVPAPADRAAARPHPVSVRAAGPGARSAPGRRRLRLALVAGGDGGAGRAAAAGRVAGQPGAAVRFRWRSRRSAGRSTP